jgi:endoglucanase
MHLRPAAMLLTVGAVSVCGLAAGCVGAAAEEGFSAQKAQHLSATATDGGSSAASSSSGDDNGSGDTGATGGDGGAAASSGSGSAEGGVVTSPTAPVYPTLDAFVGGTNLSGGEFAPDSLPGVLGSDYAYPTTAEVDSFYADGMRIFRISFLWERLQPKLTSSALDATELQRVVSIVSYATGKGAFVILDPQDFARYNGMVIGAGNGTTHPTAADFGAFWGQLARQFASDPKVIFGLVNEPNTMATELWLADANTAIASIRAAGATNLIFVPGNNWTGAESWTTANDYGTPNSQVMLGVKDPLDNYLYEMHQYFDADSSGNSATCAGPTGPERLAEATAWLEANHKKAFLAELAVSTDASCANYLVPTMQYLQAHEDAWAGWTWWAAGPLWGNYMFSIEPKTGPAVSLLPTLQKYL